jgi:hypothetical protein
MTPAEWESYKKLHPDADRSKHKIVKTKSQPGKVEAPGAPKPGAPAKAPSGKPQGKKPPPLPPAQQKKSPPPLPPKKKPGDKPEDKHDDHGEDKHEAKGGRFDGWKKSLKGLKDSAVKFVENSPKALKSFLGDPDFRKAALNEAKEGVVKLPKAAKERLVQTVKEEVHEFKEAGAGIKAVMAGKKMSKHQKHAFKAVATHLAIGVAAAAFAATGPLVGAAVFSKNLATHVGLKAVRKALGSLHTMNEVNHIGHGVMHLFEHIASEGESKKEVDPEEAMINLIMAATAKQMEQLSDQDFTEVLNKTGEEGGDPKSDGEKTAKRVLAAYNEMLVPDLGRAAVAYAAKK